MSTEPDWALLRRPWLLARQKGVDFAVHYQEVSDEWSGEVYSAAQAERYAGKPRGFATTVEVLCDWLESI